MDAFATADDLLGTTPGQVPWLSADQVAMFDDIGRVLMRATQVIQEAATTGYYIDDAGNPVDDRDKQALRDACCAQVEQWCEVGEENDIAGYNRGTSMGTGGLTVSSLPATVAPRARRILRQAGLGQARAW